MSHHSSKSNPSYNISLHHLLHPVLFYLHNNFLIYSAICYTSYHSISKVSFTRPKINRRPYALQCSNCAEIFSFITLVTWLTSMMIMTYSIWSVIMTLIVSCNGIPERCFPVYRDIRNCTQSRVIGCCLLASMRDSRWEVVLHDAASKVNRGRQYAKWHKTYELAGESILLSAYAKLWEATSSFMSVRTEQLGSIWRIFMKFYIRVFSKIRRQN
jgi:hypothetical protein